MKTLAKSTLALMLAAAFSYAPLQAQAGLFDDDEARRAILDMRARIDAVNARVDGKADKTSSLDLSGQNEQLRNEIAKLRGQIEVLTNEVANTQRRQKDFYTDLDGRLRKLEPRQATVDGKEVEVQPAEQKNFDAALALFKAGDYRNAGQAFSDFLRLYPQSGYTAAAHYWLGNAYYAQRDYKNAVASLQVVASNYPDNPKAPDALLNIASCQMELKDKAGARKSLETLTAKYPNAEAAQTARERLLALK
jgi:tol-pal system protein YbgF